MGNAYDYHSGSMSPREYETMYRLEDNYWWYVGIRKIAAVIIKNIIPEGSGMEILDAGCGTGGNFEFLKAFGTVTGVELSCEAARYIKKRSITRFVNGTVTALPFANDTFDLVTVFYINELLEDDSLAFNEYRRVLKPGGILYLSEVAFESLRGEHDLAVGILHRYTRRDFVERLSRAGFDILRITYANTLLFPPIFLLRRLRRILQPKSNSDEASSDFSLAPKPLHGLFKATLYFEAALLKLINLPFGVSIIGVFQKPAS